MKIPFLDVARQYTRLKREIDDAIEQVLSSGWFIGGERVNSFEQKFANYTGSDYCISCGSGTDALELILRGWNIGPADEVIVPDFTWISDAEAVTTVGGKAIFVDVLPGELTIDPEKVKEAITPRTKAVIAVHLYGLPCRMDEIMAIADRYNIKVIEDCAQAPGGTYKGRKVGTLGHAAAFSFYPTKNLGAYGDGGAITTNDTALAEKVRLLANHGQPRRDTHLIEGRNSRLDVIQAAILDVKLKYLDQWNLIRTRTAGKYSDALRNTNIKPPVVTGPRSHVYHMYVVQLSKRDVFQQYLLDAGISTAIHYPKALHQLEAYGHLGLSDDMFPVSSNAAISVLSLPVFPELTDEEIEYVVRTLASVVSNML
ncbi:UDP-4-amino-4-deoxy-L-arabinose--oxoglutarate aminotransferase [Fulvivirga imtechensis AK7]|uniref:UDP-4-amino-4-deoxy-L-arabinose--oxoglutarate aminotransferase n=1 Tax=Fulvivirga imtechensis AK7 TaxID=1237149 RepID=L8JMX2_9BACT|nr:DegT/DnrJ/EryC1/StrS family aminotransferase [Fulvivirga imtechensis]ELR69588.1 UDP-4-amino-4-deoxy-L-arabinose--oxoglutarate aminotransferase [Fulvivirga imtechensis AK7]